MSLDCLICGGDKGLHNLWLGKPCPNADKPLIKPLIVPSLKDLTKEALSGSKASEEVKELERWWNLKRLK